jgi:hypothetical protein
MEAYVSPACTIEAIVDDTPVGWMPVTWLTIMASVIVSVGVTLGSKKTA